MFWYIVGFLFLLLFGIIIFSAINECREKNNRTNGNYRSHEYFNNDFFSRHKENPSYNTHNKNVHNKKKAEENEKKYESHKEVDIDHLYRKLVLKVHPDRARTEEEKIIFNEFMKKLNKAREKQDLKCMFRLEEEIEDYFLNVSIEQQEKETSCAWGKLFCEYTRIDANTLPELINELEDLRVKLDIEPEIFLKCVLSSPILIEKIMVRTYIKIAEQDSNLAPRERISLILDELCSKREILSLPLEETEILQCKETLNTFQDLIKFIFSKGYYRSRKFSLVLGEIDNILARHLAYWIQ